MAEYLMGVKLYERLRPKLQEFLGWSEICLVRRNATRKYFIYPLWISMLREFVLAELVSFFCEYYFIVCWVPCDINYDRFQTTTGLRKILFHIWQNRCRKTWLDLFDVTLYGLNVWQMVEHPIMMISVHNSRHKAKKRRCCSKCDSDILSNGSAILWS